MPLNFAYTHIIYVGCMTSSFVSARFDFLKEVGLTYDHVQFAVLMKLALLTDRSLLCIHLQISTLSQSLLPHGQ